MYRGALINKYTIVFLGIVIICVLFSFGTGEAKTIIVDDDGGADYVEIQYAIENATDGDVIRVYDGEYEGSNIINKSISVLGNGSLKSILRISDNEFAFKIIADQCVLDGFMINGSGSKDGALIGRTNFSRISNITFENGSKYSLTIYNSDNNIICDNVMDSFRGGSRITLEESNFNNVSNNYCTKNNITLKILDSHFNNISNNYATSQLHIALELQDSDNNSIIENLFLNHSKSPAIIMWQSSNNSILNNTFFNNYHGIIIRDNSNYNLVKFNDFHSNNWTGIRLQDSLQNNIEYNKVNRTDNFGIELINSDESIIENNVITQNRIGISLKSNSKSNRIELNEFYGNIDFGADASENEESKDAIVKHNWWGHTTGPYHEINNPDGQGDNITDYVIFDPWNIAPNDNEVPIAIISLISPNPALENEIIQFQGNGSDDGDITMYAWRSSIDGEFYNGTENIISIEILTNGTHIVYFKVRDNYGVWSDEKSSELIVNGIPKAFIDFISPNPAIIGQAINFIANGTDDGRIGNYFWRTDDIEIYNGTKFMISYSDFSPGTYKIYLKVQDDYGVWSEEVNASLIIHQRPSASIDQISPNPGVLNESIIYSANGIDDGAIKKYAWRTDDKELFNGTNAEFLYSDLSPGTYTIYLKVQDNYGVWSDEVSDVLIIHEQPVAIIESITPNPARETVIVIFSADGIDDGEIVRYAWRTENEELYNDTGADLSSLSLSPGIYTIYLKVQDNYAMWSEEVSQELVILADTDDDSIPDKDDAFSTDPAASVDSDGDGYPEEWNEGKTEADSTTGLKRDYHPDDPKKWKKESSDQFIPGFQMTIIFTAFAMGMILYHRKIVNNDPFN